ncbi:MAG: rhamnogalacturonides degradation protein RhiN [Sphingobacteriaceae bacterium]|jgi:unsaturated rhamnogalacturonyl hydrolase|nr:rhamnogalacturonides degradation protein RhiN [Sphingobacteriaceae bacterium]
MNYILKRFSVVLLVVLLASTLKSQSLSEQMAATVMDIWKDSLVVTPGKPVKWAYDQGVVLEGIESLWKRTANPDYFDYMQKSMDLFVDKEGNIRTYKQADYNIDNVKNGRTLLSLFKVTGQKKYLKAAETLYQQLKNQPRTNEGGFWHKKVYPYQMWLDGLYMGEPFYTEYAAMVNDEKAFDDIANQFIFMEKHARDPKTGLLYHGWDESKNEKWADKSSGTSPNFWGRAMGWYAMALVDVLDNFPASHPKRGELINILTRTASAIKGSQDSRSGVWFDILDKPSLKGNYLESSVSSMFVYALAKGVRNGYLPKAYLKVAKKGYAGIQKQFIEKRSAGGINLTGTVSVSGLGGTKPYRDGSTEYYLSEKVIINDPKGVGAFLLASGEMELGEIPKTGKGKLVLLDGYFNNEYRKNALDGGQERYHYQWNERDANGYSFFGQAFTYRGATTSTLYDKPTAANLAKANVYIIVDPDTEKETEKPNFVAPDDITAIANWVKNGGVLLLLGNDLGNAEFTHFNKLAETFGIHFIEESKNKVPTSQYENGMITIPANNAVFKTANKVYIKELSRLKLDGAAKPALRKGEDVIVATAKYGKGMVVAAGDPWFYNEYTDGRKDYPDGRKLPKDYENYKAANDLAQWLLQQAKARK